jgi:hypothetical protein
LYFWKDFRPDINEEVELLQQKAQNLLPTGTVLGVSPGLIANGAFSGQSHVGQASPTPEQFGMQNQPSPPPGFDSKHRIERVRAEPFRDRWAEVQTTQHIRSVAG